MVVEDYNKRIEEMRDPHVVYVTDLVVCSHKRQLRIQYPLLHFSFEPPLLLGLLVHRGLEALLTSDEKWRAEYPIETTIRIKSEEYTIKGRIDLVRVDDKGNIVEIVEIKTAKTLPENAPLEHHVMQVKAYMKLTRAHKGLIVYITPDRVAEFEVEKADIDIKRLLSETVYDLVHPRYGWECKYCPYKKICSYAVRTK